MEESLVDLNFRLWTIGFTLFNALVLFWIMRKLLFKPVADFIENRKATIRKQVDEADALKKQAGDLKSNYESRLANIHEEKIAIINDAHKRGDELYQKMKEDADKERERILKSAENEKNLMAAKAREELRNEAVNLSVNIAEALIKKEINTDTNKQIIDSIVKDLSAMKV